MKCTTDSRGRSSKFTHFAHCGLALALAATTAAGASALQPSYALAVESDGDIVIISAEEAQQQTTNEVTASLQEALSTNISQADEQLQQIEAAYKEAEAAKPVNIALRCAYSQQGVAYRYGGSNPDTGFDCSGFTRYCYAQAGIELSHNAAAQYSEGTKVTYEDLQPGDLVFFGSGGISHVGMYIGDGMYIHAPQTGDVVKIAALSSHPNYVGACRVA